MNQVNPSRTDRIVILGALSAIAEATARQLAANGASLALVARDGERLAAVADDLRVRGATLVTEHVLDLVDHEDKSAALADITEALGGLDGALLFYGVLGDQDNANSSPQEVRRIIDVNFTSAAEWTTAAATRLKESSADRPCLVAISSVAGDRGRRSNYAYGAAKGGLSVFLQGLAHRFADEGRIHAVALKLGFVRTPMTAHLKTSGPLWADPDDIAKIVLRAMKKGGPIQYGPGFWRLVMLAIRSTPSFVFNRVNL
ncbi:MAG: SDR family NAD(P)-dependent oxidoreductase [Pseudomonadota bacterium]